MKTITLKTKDDLDLNVMYEVVDCPKGIIQLCHGMCEHKERYEAFMTYLSQQGYIVVIHDHRGHGTHLKQEHLGYFGPSGANYLVEDVYVVNQWIKQLYPDIPLYLFGHSMGSLIVRAYNEVYGHTIDKLIICGSPSYNRLVRIGQGLTSLLIKIKGPYYRSHFVNHLAFGYYNKGYNQEKSAHQWICSDEDIVKHYDNDPYCNFIFTVDGYHALFTLVDKAYHIQSAKNKTLPVLFISGKDDPCLINLDKFNYAVNTMKKAGYTNIQVVLYDDMRHEILNEKNNHKVYEDVLKFVGEYPLFNLLKFCDRK